jgi:dihydrofolate reductase
MGRKTWESKEVGGVPLPRRRNIVVTRRTDLAVPDGVLVAPSLEAALAAARAPGIDAAFVVGGAELYRAAFAHRDVRWIYLTRVEGSFGCDAFIPDLDDAFERDAWDGDAELEDNGVRYAITRLRRRRERA